ncbi:PPE family protein [Mycobacterium arosiense]|uniref:PPE family protein n=1 Tax=Mycobacterium arosiense ATCC BAA-1401 = DSM 45069 TaxID=1265311 RepID=A0A1W9ZAV4_MYCAI|nr:PPE family protein [Mycobacterium arosiense]ORA10755.1 PPE family protein [Mycobacterium arosiense ATCC BAA-1401 = DSM 45069]
MTFDFGAMPPEVNSLRMYTGAGAGPMMAAAAAFSSLADELSTTAAASQAAIANLTGEEWMGPSSVAMVTAAQPYVQWMHTTAGQLQQAAAQAMASAAAYEAAFAMTVPPPLVAANRAQLAALVATNVLGQNTPAIAATEAQYAEMWAQDAAAMYGYAASSAAAARLSPLTSPAPTNSPGGLGVQTAATTAQTSGLRGVVSNVPNAVQSFAAPAALPDPPGLSALDSVLSDPVVSNVGNAGFDVVSWNVFNTIVSNILYNHTLDTAAAAGVASDVQGAVGGGALVSAAAPVSTAGGGAAPVLASMGAASPVGGLSTPAAWSAATPRVVPAETVAGTGWTAPAEETQTTWASGMPAVASAGRGGYGMGPRYGVKPKVMPTRLLV